jgi:hypothetical protein
MVTEVGAFHARQREGRRPVLQNTGRTRARQVPGVGQVPTVQATTGTVTQRLNPRRRGAFQLFL